jgi:RNA polymerase sigma-70 factor (sigma-E family)
MRVDPGFDDFVESRSTALLRTAYLLTGDRGHAEDLLQTALLRTARRWSAAREHPEAYTRQVLMNLSRDRLRLLRRRPRESVIPDGDEASGWPPTTAADGGSDPVGTDFTRRHSVAEALRHLPIRQRQAVVLRFFDDLPVAQTAALMGCSEGAVKSYTARALDKLRALLTDHVTDQLEENSDAH